MTKRPCSDLLPGHRHCEHGHTEDCPDPDNCDLLPLPRQCEHGHSDSCPDPGNCKLLPEPD